MFALNEYENASYCLIALLCKSEEYHMLHLSLWTPQRSSISISWSEHTSLIWQCKLSVLWKKAARMPLLYFAEKDVLEKDGCSEQIASA